MGGRQKTTLFMIKETKRESKRTSAETKTSEKE
ncbi:hypothetical protein HS7_06030 [Sulfolobales archaeon HS-7]|nr:hypothetical protein HS7_06030 [Sulfolobales archaeon HS-7]